MYGKQDLPADFFGREDRFVYDKIASEVTSEMLVLVARRVEGEDNYSKLCTVPYFRSPGKSGISAGECHHDCQL